MPKRATAVAIALLVAFAATARADEAASGHEGWYAEFDAAAAAAKEQGKNLLVDFTGSDWCGWCIKLKQEVFDHQAFLDAVKDDYVLLALDFPRSEEAKAKVPDPEQNAALRDKYGVRGYPTILLMKPDGTVFGRTGYQRGGPEAYLTHMAELKEKGMKALADVAEFEKSFATAEGEEKATLRDQAIGRLEEMKGDEIGIGTYADVVRDVATGEATPRPAKIRATKALLKSGQADDTVKAAARELDPKNEEGILEVLVNQEISRTQKDEIAASLKKVEELDALGPIKDKDIAVNLYVNAAFWNMKFLNDKEAAKKWAAKANELGVDNPRLQQFLDQVLGS